MTEIKIGAATINLEAFKALSKTEALLHLKQLGVKQKIAEAKIKDTHPEKKLSK